MNVELFKLWLVLIAVASAAAVDGRRTLYSSAAMLLLSLVGAFEATHVTVMSGGVTTIEQEVTIAIILGLNAVAGLIFFIGAVTGTEEEAADGAESPAGRQSVTDQVRGIQRQ